MGLLTFWRRKGSGASEAPAGAEPQPEPEVELADVEAPDAEADAPALEPEPVAPAAEAPASEPQPTMPAAEANEEPEQAVEPAQVTTVVATAEPSAPNGTAAAEAMPEQPEPLPTEAAGDERALPAAEALELLRRAGKDVIEPQFLLREYRRRVEQGEAAEDVRERLEALLAGRLRRIGELDDEQRLSLQID